MNEEIRKVFEALPPPLPHPSSHTLIGKQRNTLNHSIMDLKRVCERGLSIASKLPTMTNSRPDIAKAAGKYLPIPSHQAFKGKVHTLCREFSPVFQNDVGPPIIRQLKVLKAVAAAGVSLATLSSAVCSRCWAVGNKRLQCLKPRNPVPSTSLGTLPPCALAAEAGLGC